MATTKVLITVKTYPTISSKYDELVCTAGLLEDGSWIRIYPIPFRKKDYEQQYSKYDWIEIDLVNNKSDFRPESYRPYSAKTKIAIIDKINTDHNWQARKDIVLQNVHYDLASLILDAHNKEKCTSLATYKPKEIIDFVAEPVSRKWDQKKIAKLKASREQGNLFEHPEDPFDVVDKLPYKFSYVFLDKDGKQRKMMIEDWETGALYWRQLAKYEGNEEKAVSDVIKKYLNDFAKTKDLYFFLGTTQLHHYRSHNPFVIIGTFTPKIDIQTKLF
ncbi:hypothetical protein [Dokdonia sp.]|uniref:hypothetical protein n=1 Tax=Dokdonia sp. TaxID=2024995 RepID=UPI003265323B